MVCIMPCPELVAQGLTCGEHLIHVVELRKGGNYIAQVMMDHRPHEESRIDFNDIGNH